MMDQFRVNEPQLPRKRRAPQQYGTGSASESSEFAISPKDDYRRLYYESFDLAVIAIKNRFDQEGF